MISYIEGKILLRGERFVVIDGGGVGYRIFVGPETFKKLPGGGEKAKIWTYLYVRENALELYGFLDFAELEFFETLIQIPGIGPKSALGILGVAPLDTLKRAIASEDTSYLTKVSGIGRKVADKIVVELKEKLGKGGIYTGPDPDLREEEDALLALQSLGYSQRQAREALREVPQKIQGTQDRVKAALKILGKK